MTKIAADTNIMLYALDSFDPKKQAIAIDLIESGPAISSQNVSEFANVCLKKWKLSKDEVAQMINTQLKLCVYHPLSEKAILKGIEIMGRYNLQFFDSLIVGAALISDCSILYSEDMSDGLVIDDKLKIINPLIEI